MLVKTHITELCPQIFDSIGLRWVPIMCISNKLLVHANAAGSEITLREGLV